MWKSSSAARKPARAPKSSRPARNTVAMVSRPAKRGSARMATSLQPAMRTHRELNRGKPSAWFGAMLFHTSTGDQGPGRNAPATRMTVLISSPLKAMSSSAGMTSAAVSSSGNSAHSQKRFARRTRLCICCGHSRFHPAGSIALETRAHFAQAFAAGGSFAPALQPTRKRCSVCMSPDAPDSTSRPGRSSPVCQL